MPCGIGQLESPEWLSFSAFGYPVGFIITMSWAQSLALFFFLNEQPAEKRRCSNSTNKGTIDTATGWLNSPSGTLRHYRCLRGDKTVQNKKSKTDGEKRRKPGIFTTVCICYSYRHKPGFHKTWNYNFTTRVQNSTNISSFVCLNLKVVFK